jgi:hypothetical protein
MVVLPGTDEGGGKSLTKKMSLYDKFWDDILTANKVVMTQSGLIAGTLQTSLTETAADILSPFTSTVNGTTVNGVTPSKNRFLPLLLGGMALVAYAPVAYKAYASGSRGRRRKGVQDTVVALDAASSRATAMITAFAPIVAMPAAYIAVDELENREIISGPLGDDVQVLIAAMASGQLVSGLLGLVTKAI